MSSEEQETENVPEPLKFKVSPHIVEDLGLNLYTTIARVIVEYVANAYDADSPYANIAFDKSEIDRHRRALRLQWEKEKTMEEGKKSPKYVQPLESRTLPDDIKIVIEDAGCGMSRDELNSKFLFAGRRRRKEETALGGRTPVKKRPIMGRKGLGKLAGFGAAKLITVETKNTNEPHATRIVLNYDELVKKKLTHEIVIDNEEKLPDGAGLGESGTRITLSRLLYDPLKSRSQTIENEIVDHFALIDPSDFQVNLNEATLDQPPPNFSFAWPNPKTLDVLKFVEKELITESGKISFKYRMRFTGERESLPASKRGVRVYSNKRLAAAPSLLAADTNMHGFRMTDYLDGVVHADFIENQESDYIATDRQSLRWESPLLSDLHDFLSSEIKEACKEYQKVRDGVSPNIVKNDSFTKDVIEKASLSEKDERMAIRIAVILKNACKQGVEDEIYKTKLPVLVRGIGHGSILSAITELANEENPDLQYVAVQLAKLTKDELERFVSTVKVRLKGISALKKIVESTNFKDAKDEKAVQKLFELSPWLIDPTFSQFLTADETIETLLVRLSQELKIGKHALGDDEQNIKRPDLVFLIGNRSLKRIVIVELKAANVPLTESHRSQLRYYMTIAKKWLRNNSHGEYQVHGHLIGTMPHADTKSEGGITLLAEMERAGPDSDWIARDFLKVLEDAEDAHRDLLQIERESEIALNSNSTGNHDSQKY